MLVQTDTLIPNDIQLWRRKAGMNQRQFAEALVLSRYRISLWEQGRTLPNWHNLNRIAELLHCQVSQLYRSGLVLQLLSELETQKLSD